MAHTRNRFDADAAPVMFSPSVTRIAATEARDWTFVDSWLTSWFSGRQPPPFERNADTLKSMLALIAFNETAEAEAGLLARVDQDALEDLPQCAIWPAKDDAPSLLAVRDSLLDIIRQEMPKEGRVALSSLATMSVSARVAHPEPEQLSAAILDTQSAIFDVEQMTARAETLERQILSEIANARDILHSVQEEGYRLPDGLAKRKLEVQRAVKAMTAQVPEFERRVASLRETAASSEYSVHDILREEEDYINLVENRKGLEKRISVFRGLPSDPELARNELNAYKKELQGITSRRDAAFQGLVERETPVTKK